MSKKASRTAELTALARASMHREPALRGPDHVAIRFLSAPLKMLVSLEPLRRVALKLYPEELSGFLERNGFGLEEVVKADTMAARYFAQAPKDSEPHRLANFYAIAVARTKG